MVESGVEVIFIYVDVNLTGKSFLGAQVPITRSNTILNTKSLYHII